MKIPQILFRGSKDAARRLIGLADDADANSSNPAPGYGGRLYGAELEEAQALANRSDPEEVLRAAAEAGWGTQPNEALLRARRMGYEPAGTIGNRQTGVYDLNDEMAKRIPEGATPYSIYPSFSQTKDDGLMMLGREPLYGGGTEPRTATALKEAARRAFMVGQREKALGRDYVAMNAKGEIVTGEFDSLPRTDGFVPVKIDELLSENFPRGMAFNNLIEQAKAEVVPNVNVMYVKPENPAPRFEEIPEMLDPPAFLEQLMKASKELPVSDPKSQEALMKLRFIQEDLNAAIDAAPEGGYVDIAAIVSKYYSEIPYTDNSVGLTGDVGHVILGETGKRVRDGRSPMIPALRDLTGKLAAAPVGLYGMNQGATNENADGTA